jgi:hypothetical protein
MPFRHKTLFTGGQHIPVPFVGPVDHTVSVPVNLAALTNKEIDADGYLKPGIPLTKAGALVASGSVFGVTVDYVKVAEDNASGTIAALGTVDIPVATICQVNQDVAEDILGRIYSAAELAGMAPGASGVVLL